MKRNLRKLLEKGELLCGMVINSGSPNLVEILGYSGFDFVFIDTEHSSLGVDRDLENMLRAAEVSGLMPIVRVKGNDENLIRNVLEMGAQGVVVPRIETREEMERAIAACKFPTEGCRGASADVRANTYGVGDSDFPTYVKKSNETALVIPVVERPAFFENIEEIMDLDELKVVDFGPCDYALSIGLPISSNFFDYPELREAFDKLTSTAKRKGKFLMGSPRPLTLEKAREIVEERQYRMLVFRSDMVHFGSACKRIKEDIFDKLK